ncbi:MAG: hypothetical protein JW814_10510 [Candidatus Krumholzibacteriota bacterium]|nr:hypothetical protein [Candidatus Krumholzibacteriota bacterium]
MTKVNESDRIKKPGGGHLFWAVVFSVMGILSLARKMMVIGGVPVWAISFFLIGASNLLKAPAFHSLLRLDGSKAERISKTGTAVNIVGIAFIVIAFIIEVYRN